MADERILVVEDDQIIALELEDRLANLGYAVCAVASSGEEALARVGELLPEMVLMDIRLKGAMDGIQTAAQIRNSFDIPVVFLTAYADQSTLQRAKITEPYGFITKPFEERDLQAAIEVALYKHRMERKLRESERWLATTLGSIGDAVVATDSEGLVAFMNTAAEGLTGWEQADALGREANEILQVIDGDTLAVLENPVTKALQTGSAQKVVDRLLLSRDGTQTPVDGNATLIRGDGGDLRGAVLVFQDIGERKREQQERESLQAQLFQAQKLEAIGVLVGGIAHDFNNLLTTIIGTSSLVLSGIADRSPLRGRVERIKRASERAALLTHQILAFSRGQTPEAKILDLNAVILDLKDMLQRLVGEDTEVIYLLEPGRKYVKADPSQVEQVLMNLVINAHEAMPGGGTLTIKTETITMDEEQCQHFSQAQPGAFVRLSIQDTGSGMDQETMPHIFEPFFSTKEMGTGLGLTIVRNLVEGYEGGIDVLSEPGQGSTFRVNLPACFAGLEYEADGSVIQPQIRGRGERILLVEDDEGVREAVAEMLGVGGYIVVGAASAQEALSVFEREEGDFDLLLSDVVLPDEDGLYLADWLLSQRPELAVLLTSGYPDQRAQWPIIREKGFRFLRKPYGLAELLPAIREVIGAESP